MTKNTMKILPFLKLNGQYQLYDRFKCEFLSLNSYDKIITDFYTSYAVVKNKKYGILDENADLIIDCSYDLARGFDENGLALVRINQRYGFINKKNEFVIPPIHEYISDFYEGLASVKVGDKIKFMDTTGSFISRKEYEETGIFWGGTCAVKINGKWGLIDKHENILISPEYDSLFEENNICRVEKEGKYFLVDINNTQVSEKYDYIDYLSDGMHQVSRDGLAGHINQHGEIVIPLVYENCTDFHGEFCGAYLDGKWFFINKDNTKVFKPHEYNLPEILNSIEDGITVASNGEGWGIIDIKSGKKVTDFIYDQSWGISGGLCSFLKNGKWGYVDNTGNERIDFKYYDTNSFQDGISHVSHKNSLTGSIAKFYIDDHGVEFREK